MLRQDKNCKAHLHIILVNLGEFQMISIKSAGDIRTREHLQTSKFREFMSPAIIVYYLNEKK